MDSDEKIELRIAIEISGASMEEESALVNIIADKLTERGFKNVFTIASENMYTDPSISQQVILPPEQPIVTVVSTALH
jgi:hypothetical protein